MFGNNYNYNPYNRYTPQPQMQQPIQQPQTIIPPQQNNLNGKVVESIDVVRAMDIPLDGSISYYPISSGEAIVTKQLQMDGTSKMTIFKPVVETKDEVKYITSEDMKKAIDELDFSEIDDIKEELKDLKKEIKDLKKKNKGD